MRLGAIAALVASVLLAAFVVFHIGIGQVFEAAGRVGWGGFVLICFAGILSTEAALGAAWYTLLAGRGHPWLLFVAARQLRDSSSDLLPFTQVGGMVFGGRAAVLGGVPSPLAFASVMVDVTIELIGQIAFIVIGLAFGLAELRASATLGHYANAMIYGTALMVPILIAFVVVQRRGSGFAEKLAARFLPAAVRHTEAFSKELHALYGKPVRLLLSCVFHISAWLLSGVWIWLIVRLCGAELDVFSAITIEALLAAVRSALVFIPSAIGVQEAGYAMLAPVFGLGPEVGLAVSLLKRARDIAVGVPVLLLWQAVEGRRAFAKPAEEP